MGGHSRSPNCPRRFHFPKAAILLFNAAEMKSALMKFGLASLLTMLTFSVLAATNSPAPARLADTNFIDPEITADSPQVAQLKEVMKKEGFKPENMLNESFLFASLFWGTLGGGYLLYARKQREIVPFVGGVAMIAVSFLVTSWFWMSLICIALMFAVWQLVRQGY